VAKTWRLVLFGSTILFFFLVLFFVYNPLDLQFIKEWKVFAQAEKWCTQPNMHLDLLEKPHGIEAELLTCAEILRETTIRDCGGLASDEKAWLVSMEGKWNLWGPPPIEGTHAPMPLTRCVVMIDVTTGDGLNGYWGE
jgi:hypothetical protein